MLALAHAVEQGAGLDLRHPLDGLGGAGRGLSGGFVVTVLRWIFRERLALLLPVFFLRLLWFAAGWLVAFGLLFSGIFPVGGIFRLAGISGLLLAFSGGLVGGFFFVFRVFWTW